MPSRKALRSVNDTCIFCSFLLGQRRFISITRLSPGPLLQHPSPRSSDVVPSTGRHPSSRVSSANYYNDASNGERTWRKQGVSSNNGEGRQHQSLGDGFQKEDFQGRRVGQRYLNPNRQWNSHNSRDSDISRPRGTSFTIRRYGHENSVFPLSGRGEDDGRSYRPDPYDTEPGRRNRASTGYSLSADGYGSMNRSIAQEGRPRQWTLGQRGRPRNTVLPGRIANSEAPSEYEPSDSAPWAIWKSKDSVASPIFERNHENGQRTRNFATPQAPTATGLSELLARRSESHTAPGTRKPDKAKERRRRNFITNLEDQDVEDDESKILRKRRLERKREKDRLAREAASSRLPQLRLPEHITVNNLATLLSVRLETFVDKMEDLGFTNVTYDYILSAENAGLISMEYGFEPVVDKSSVDLFPAPMPESRSGLPERPPIVTIMGHVDHGKTTILDYLRKSRIAASEAGGITQHIGAFVVPLSSGKRITFLDTPGHAAFLSMRQRGANVTDIVVLVVAADDGVMPQTLEAIKHAKEAKVPMIVAINKIDKPEAAAEQVKMDLARHEVEIEDFGGDTQVVNVSGKTGEGVDKLEEAIITLSEIQDHRAPIDGSTEGWVLEASMKNYGRVATVLVKRGILKPGHVIVAGCSWARVKTLRNEAGILVEEVGPGIPVEVDGWKSQPSPGDQVLQAADEQTAASVMRTREAIASSFKLAKDMEMINETRRGEHEKRDQLKRERKAAQAQGQRIKDDRVRGAFEFKSNSSGILEAFLVVKADVNGSAEAVVNMISGLGNHEVRPNIMRSGTGVVSESDVELALSAKGHIISFDAEVDPRVRRMAEENGVRILEHSIIYRVVEDVNQMLSNMLPPKIVQRVSGEAEILQSFEVPLGGRKKGLAAGCRVRNGVVRKGSKARVIRAGENVYDGVIASLRNLKKDVSEMKKDSECGIVFEDWQTFETGDQVQCYEETEEKRTL